MKLQYHVQLEGTVYDNNSFFYHVSNVPFVPQARLPPMPTSRTDVKVRLTVESISFQKEKAQNHLQAPNFRQTWLVWTPVHDAAFAYLMVSVRHVLASTNLKRIEEWKRAKQIDKKDQEVFRADSAIFWIFCSRDNANCSVKSKLCLSRVNTPQLAWSKISLFI